MRYIIFLFIFSLLCNTSLVYASGPDGYLIIPELGLLKSVHMIPDSDLSSATYYYNLEALGSGVGHLQYTSWGHTNGGRAVLVGHTPGAFEKIHTLEIGDEIILSMNESYYSFIIFDKYIVFKDNGEVLSTPSDTFEVVLITCVDENRRLILKAK